MDSSGGPCFLHRTMVWETAPHAAKIEPNKPMPTRKIKRFLGSADAERDHWHPVLPLPDQRLAQRYTAPFGGKCQAGPWARPPPNAPLDEPMPRDCGKMHAEGLHYDMPKLFLSNLVDKLYILDSKPEATRGCRQPAAHNQNRPSPSRATSLRRPCGDGTGQRTFRHQALHLTTSRSNQ